MVGANPDAFPTINTTFGNDMSLPVSHADGFGGASFDTVGAAHALITVERNGMEKTIQTGHLPITD